MIDHIVNSIFFVFEKKTQYLKEKSDFSWSALLYEVLCESLLYNLNALHQIYHTSDKGVNS